MRPLLLWFSLLAIVAQAHLCWADERIWRIGLLSNGPAQFRGIATSWRDEALRVLGQNGFTQGHNLELLEKYSEGKAERLPGLAKELANASVDVIITISDPAARAAATNAPTTPIVMVVGSDPVSIGLVQSFAHPGGKLTGIYFQTVEGDAKRLQLLTEAIPGARRFGYLEMTYNQHTPIDEEITRAAGRLGIELTAQWISGPNDYASAFETMRQVGDAGVVIGAAQPLGSDAQRIAATAMKHQLPTICEWAYMARVGCVLAYGHDLAYAQRRVGEYVARILKGAAASELPVEQPDAWKLTVNSQAAKKLGLHLPSAILARADEVIE
jgi:putative ABC transport system substrate-binding protein